MPRPTAQEMKDHVYAIAEKHGGKVLDYKNSTTNVFFQCKNGHEFSMWPNTVRYGHWCPQCRKDKEELGSKLSKADRAKEKGRKQGIPPPYTPVWRRFGVLSDHTLAPKSIMIWNEEGKRLRMSIRNMDEQEQKDVLYKCDLLKGKHVVVKGWERGEGVRRNSDWFRDITLDDKTEIDLPIRGKQYVDTVKELKEKIDWQNRPRLGDMLSSLQDARHEDSIGELQEQIEKVRKMLEQSVDRPVQRAAVFQEFEELAQRMGDIGRVREEATEEVQLNLRRVTDQFNDLRDMRNHLAHQGRGLMSLRTPMSEINEKLDQMVEGAERIKSGLEGGLGSLRQDQEAYYEGLLGRHPEAKRSSKSAGSKARRLADLAGSMKEPADDDDLETPKFARVTDKTWHKGGYEFGQVGGGAVGKQIRAAISSAKQMQEQAEQARKQAEDKAQSEAHQRMVAEKMQRTLEAQLNVVQQQLDQMSQPQGPSDLELAEAHLTAARAERDAMRFERDLLQERQRNREVLERLQVSMNLSAAANEALRQQMEAEQVADDPQQKEYDKDKQYFATHHPDFVGKSFAIRVRTNKNNHAKNELALRAGIDMGERTQIEAMFMKYETGNVFTVVFPEFNSTTRIALHHNGTDVYLKTVFNDTPGWVKAENKIGGANCKRRTDLTREAFVGLYEDIMRSLGG